MVAGFVTFGDRRARCFQSLLHMKLQLFPVFVKHEASFILVQPDLSNHVILGKKVNKSIFQTMKLFLNLNLTTFNNLPSKLVMSFCVSMHLHLFYPFVTFSPFSALCSTSCSLMLFFPLLIYSLSYNLFPSCLSLFHISVACGQGKVPH